MIQCDNIRKLLYLSNKIPAYNAGFRLLADLIIIVAKWWQMDCLGDGAAARWGAAEQLGG